MNRKYLFQYYLVAFLDILGQRENLRRLTILPTNEEEKSNFFDSIDKSHGNVMRVRKYLNDFFGETCKPNINLVAPEHQEHFIACRKSEVSFYAISDSIVIYVPLMNNDEYCTAINGVYSALIATSGTALSALSNSIAVRGGIDIGIATEIDENEIYGPGLERAVHLEHNLAEYPRFVIGNELMNYLSLVENQDFHSNPGKIAKKNAKRCKSLIIRDTDGRYMLDFLGPKLKQLLCNIGRDTVIAARKFVEQEYNKYTLEENQKLMSRYFRLLHYFTRRHDVWKLP